MATLAQTNFHPGEPWRVSANFSQDQISRFMVVRGSENKPIPMDFFNSFQLEITAARVAAVLNREMTPQ